MALPVWLWKPVSWILRQPRSVWKSWGLSSFEQKGSGSFFTVTEFNPIISLASIPFHVHISKWHLIRIRARRAALKAPSPVAVAVAAPAEMPKKGYGHVLTCRPIHESMVVSLCRDRWFVWGWYVLHCLAMIPRVYGIYTCAVLLLFRKPCHTCQTHPHQRCGPAVQVAWMPWIPCQCHLSVLQLRLLLLRPARQSNPCLRQWHKVSARPSISRRTIQRRLRLCKSKVVLCPLKLY